MAEGRPSGRVSSGALVRSVEVICDPVVDFAVSVPRSEICTLYKVKRSTSSWKVHHITRVRGWR